MSCLKSTVARAVWMVVIAVVAWAFFARAVNAQVGELASYVELTHISSLSESDPSGTPTDFSGIAYNWDTNTLFIVNNRDTLTAIYEYSLGGTYLRKIEVVDFATGANPPEGDMEGICYLGGDEFAIVDERVSEILIATIDENTTQLDRDTDFDVIDVDIAVQSGDAIEGVAYNPLEDFFYVVKETNGLGVYKVLNNGTTTELFDADTDLTPGGIATDNPADFTNGLKLMIFPETW